MPKWLYLYPRSGLLILIFVLGKKAIHSEDFFHCWCHNENTLSKIFLHINETTTHFAILDITVVINLLTSLPKYQGMSVLFGLLSVE